MDEALLRGIAAELNGAPRAAGRVGRLKTLVEDNNNRIAAESVQSLPFDSSPYGFQSWLAAADRT